MNLIRLKDDIIRDEGLKFEIYLDTLGFKTFGIGHKITDGDPEYLMPVGSTVLPTRVWEVFEKDLEIKIKHTKNLFEPYWTVWPDEVQEILVNMCFNLGKNGLSKFVKMREALNKRNWKLAAQEGRDSLWYRQVRNRAERLMTRLENIEADL